METSNFSVIIAGFILCVHIWSDMLILVLILQGPQQPLVQNKLAQPLARPRQNKQAQPLARLRRQRQVQWNHPRPRQVR